jgi:hypothetical protein
MIPFTTKKIQSNDLGNLKTADILRSLGPLLGAVYQRPKQCIPVCTWEIIMG